MSPAVTLPERLDAAALEPLRQTLLQHRGADLSVAAQSVTRLDGQGLQLLLSALETWRQDGHALAFNQPSDVLTRAFDSVGLTISSNGAPA